jgi:uncharacterized protein (UPF0548 family)
MFSVRPPSAADLARVAADQARCDLSYAEHGATEGPMPPGYHHDQWQADLGSYDPARFERLAVALGAWQAQRGAGLTIFPDKPVSPRLTIAFSVRVAATYVTAAVRVVCVTAEPDRAGFAYGTLPQHPEQGEEAFHVVRDGERILFRITAFSRPRHPLARLGAPVSRIVQARMSRAYLQAMRSVAGSDRT